MLPSEQASGHVVWDNPERCPFCEGALEDGGPGFMDHIADRPECEAGFETWRERVVLDVGSEWIA
ncbi:MAG: hypothetical protein R3324_18025 [Halobacteriales archaeon]|nr:hypothetical protein [Halobacteriales archaeon]